MENEVFNSLTRVLCTLIVARKQSEMRKSEKLYTNKKIELSLDFKWRPWHAPECDRVEGFKLFL